MKEKSYNMENWLGFRLQRQTFEGRSLSGRGMFQTSHGVERAKKNAKFLPLLATQVESQSAHSTG